MATIVALVLGFIVSIPVVRSFLSRYALPVSEVIDLLDAVLDAVKDGKIDPDEAKRIIQEARQVGDLLIFKDRVRK